MRMLSSPVQTPNACLRTVILLNCLVCAAPHESFSVEPQAAGDYSWNLPRGFPKPRIPADNPMTAWKVELGRYLFYDTRLSVNGKASCATCHKQELAFTDGLPVSVGATREAHPRGSMSLVNVAYSTVLTWSNPSVKNLEAQALIPMYRERPVELGLRADDNLLTDSGQSPCTPIYFGGPSPWMETHSRDRTSYTQLPVSREVSPPLIRRMIATIMAVTTMQFPNQASEARSCFFRSSFPVSDVILASISATEPTPRTAAHEHLNSTIRAYTTSPE
jgi:Di-haem cytochrome c peroxidase